MANTPLLFVFDFDGTIVLDDSDLLTLSLIEDKFIPNYVQSLPVERGWIDYMSEMFRVLHRNGFKHENIIVPIVRMKGILEMDQLIAQLAEDGIEIVISSTSSNSLFITSWLTNRVLNDCVTKVFANPAKYDEDGLITVGPYHENSWCYSCPENMCKGFVLDEYRKQREKEGVKFKSTVYIGSSEYNICPALMLKKSDLLLCRVDSPLHFSLRTCDILSKELHCKWLSWKNGSEIMELIDHIFYKR